MKLAKRVTKRRERRAHRVRNVSRATGRVRLSVFRSNKHIYAQIIDDVAGKTLVAASTTEKELGGAGTPGGSAEDAEKVGAAIANAVAALDLTLYGALPERRGKSDPYAPRPRDSAALRALKERMRTLAGQEIYRERSEVSERVNGDLKTWRGLGRLTVRGVGKVTCVALLNVIAYNLLRWIAVGPAVGSP